MWQPIPTTRRTQWGHYREKYAGNQAGRLWRATRYVNTGRPHHQSESHRSDPQRKSQPGKWLPSFRQRCRCRAKNVSASTRPMPLNVMASLPFVVGGRNSISSCISGATAAARHSSRSCRQVAACLSQCHPSDSAAGLTPPFFASLTTRAHNLRHAPAPACRSLGPGRRYVPAAGDFRALAYLVAVDIFFRGHMT